jgi:flagellum-specific ATP synthase
MLEVGGLPMTIGNRAAIASRHGWVECECVGFSGGTTFLMPIDPAVNVAPGAVVYPANTPALAGGRFVPIESAPPLPIGDTLMGRIVDGYGSPQQFPINSDQSIASTTHQRTTGLWGSID